MHTEFGHSDWYCSMRRSDRASSIKNSQELQSKLASREIKSNLRKQRSLSVREAIDLSSVREVDTSAKDTSSEEDQVFREEEEYWEDSSAYRFTDPELLLSDSSFFSLLLIQAGGLLQLINLVWILLKPQQLKVTLKTWIPEHIFFQNGLGSKF